MYMEDDEFSHLTARLEQYASQMATLQTRMEMQQDYDELKRKYAALEQENKQLREENKRLQTEVKESEIKSSYLLNYIILSAEKIKEFVRVLHNMDRWAFLRTFVMWSVPDNLRAQEQKRIEEVLGLPQDQLPQVVMNDPTFNGPMYDVHDNEGINLE